MAKDRDPWHIPEWHALRREAALTRHLIGSGATALGKANYADQLGEYYTAFFGLSVGIERLAKLILVVDHAITNAGSMPSEERIRDFGHRLTDLADAVSEVALRRKPSLRYTRPANVISNEILKRLDEFADARRGRYANFRSLDDPNLQSHEPIRLWWDVVADAILRSHYVGKAAQAKVEANAQAASTTMSSVVSVLYIDESGIPMRDVASASLRTGQTQIVQAYGRYYTLVVVRWLAELYSELSEAACYQHGIDAFFGSWEHFRTYTVEDRFLKTRKVWP